MLQFLFEMSEAVRLPLFFLLLAYLPMRLGVSFDVAGNAPSVEQVRVERYRLWQVLRPTNALALALLPFRALALLYLAVWLATDRYIVPILALFALSVLPMYLGDS